MKKANIASLILEYEDVELVNTSIQSDILQYDHILADIKEIYENLNYDEMQKFIKELNLKERSILILNPLN